MLKALGIGALTLLAITAIELGCKLFIAQPAGSLEVNYFGIAVPYSLPSGHSIRLAIIAILAYSALTTQVLKMAELLFSVVILLLLAASVCCAIHYYSDILVGSALG